MLPISENFELMICPLSTNKVPMLKNRSAISFVDYLPQRKIFTPDCLIGEKLLFSNF